MRVRTALSTMSACQEDADDSTINVKNMHYLQDFQSTLDRIWISCIVYPNDDEEGEATPNSRFCDLMTEAVDEFYNDHVHHPAREVVSGLHNALRIIATSSHSFPPSDKLLADLCLKIYGHCVEILFDASWMSVQDEARASATKEFYNFYCCLSNWSQDRFLVLAILSQKPWGHEIMNMVLAGEENTDKAEVDRYLTLEGQYLLEHRLRVLMQEGMYHHALNLAKACTDHPDLGQELIFLETLYLLYFNLGMTDDLQIQIDDHPTIQHVMGIAESMSSYCPEHASNLSKLILERVWSDRHSSNLLVEEAAEQWLDATLKVCSPDSDAFAEGLEDISTLTKDHFHLYHLADLVHKKVGVSATPAIVSICLKALVVPSLSPVDDIIQAAEIDYGNAVVCSLLSDLLEDDMRMQWLCLLAVFFIAPSLKSLSALKDCYQDTKESRRPKLTSYQQHDLIKCMEYFIPASASLSDDWKNVLAVFEGYLRKSKVICITLKLPGGNVKRLKLYDKSWHPGRSDFKPMGVLRVKEAFYSLQRCHKGINLLSCKQERQIQPKMKRKRCVERKNSQECPKLSETTGGDDEASPVWLPCSVLDLQQEVLTEQEFNDQTCSDTPLEASCIGNASASQALQSLMKMPELSVGSGISGLETVGLVEEDRPDLQSADSIEIVDNDDLANSSRDLKAMTSKRESAETSIITQEKQLNKVPKGTKYLQISVKKCNSKSEVTMASAMSASYPEPDNSDDPTLTESSDTEIYSLINEQNSSSDHSENEDELSNDDEEQENLEQEDKQLMLSGKTENLLIDASRCQRRCSEYDEDAKYSHEFENPVSLKSKVRIVVPRCTQNEVINLEEEMSADRKSLVQSVLTDVVEAVLVKDGPAKELSFNSITQDSQGSIIEEQMHVHNCSPGKESIKYTTHRNQDEPSFQQDKDYNVEACRMSLVEGICLQHGGSRIKTSLCSVNLRCFMKQRAKKQNPKNLELWRFSIRERDKERGEDATICTDGIDFDVKSPEQDLARLSLDKAPHLGKAAAEILNDQNDTEDVPILGETACEDTKGNQSASVCSDFRIPWIEEQVVEEEQPEIDGQFPLTSEGVTRPYHETNAITSIANCVSSYVRGNSPVHDNQSLLENPEVSTECLRKLEDPIWADITSFNQGRSLESVTGDKTINLLENRTVESPMLGNEPHTCAVDEVRDVELPVLTQETEVDQRPVALDKRETNQTTFRNDLEMLSRLKDSCQKSENSDIPILLDCYEEEFHTDETHDNNASCESEVSKVLLCPEDALDLSRKPFVENVDQTAVDHIETSTVLEKECSNKIKPLESVTGDKTINSLENRTVERPMLGNEPHTCAVDEVRDVELPVLTQETEVELDERETNQTTFRNDLEMLSRMKDSCQKSENSDIPILLDCYEEEFHTDVTHDNDASCESEVSKVLVCPEDALDLSRKPFVESVDQTAVDHIETPTVLEKECSNKIKPLVSSLIEHTCIQVQQRNVHAKKSVCCINLPCSMDRTTAKEGRHSLAEEWQCILSNTESREITKNCTCDVEFDLIPQEKHDKDAPEGNIDIQNNQVEIHFCENEAGESPGNKLTDSWNEFISPMINGQVTPEEQLGVDGQILMTRESTASLNHGTDMMHKAADSSIVGGDSAVKATRPCLEIPEIFTEGTCHKLGDTLGAGMTNLHQDKSLENVPCNEIINFANLSKYGTVKNQMQEKEIQTYPVDEARNVELPIFTLETEVIKHHVTVEEEETSQGMYRNDLPIHDSSYRVEESDIPELVDCADEDFHDDDTDEYGGNDKDLICVIGVDKCSIKPIGAGIDQKTLYSTEKPMALEKENSNEFEPFLSSQMKTIDFQQRGTHLIKRSVSCVSLQCNMDRSTSRENPHTSHTYLKPLDKHLDPDLGTTEGNMIGQSNIQDLHKQSNITDDCSEFRIPWVDEQVTLDMQPEVDGQYLMLTENGMSPSDGVSMPCLGNTCVPSTIGDASAQQTHQLHLEAPELSMQCINTKTNSPISARMSDLKKDMSLENIPNEPTNLTKDSTAETQGQEHKLQRHLAFDDKGRQIEECKMVEKNSEKKERLCQGEEEELLASSELFIPWINANATPEEESSEDGINLMFQEDGIWSNDVFGHHHIPEVRQVAEIETSIKQEFVDIDSWERNCGDRSGVKKEGDLLCRVSRENKDADGVMERLSDQKPLVQESDHQFPSANENLGMTMKSKGTILVQAGSEAIAKSSKEKRYSGETEGDVDIKRTPETFLSDNCKSEPFNTSSLFGKRDAMYGVTYSRTAFKQSPVLKSVTDKPINQSPSIKRFTSKKSGKDSSSNRDSRMCPAMNTNKFISKKSLKATPSHLPSDKDQIVTHQPSIKHCASRKSHKESSSQQESQKCPVQTTNKFISKKFWTASLRQPPCERATRKTGANPKATVQRLGSEACELSHLPLQSKPTANKKKSSSSRVSVKSFSCKSQKRSCAEALPPPKLLKLSSTCTSPAQPSPKPVQKHMESSRKSVRQEVQRSSMEVHGVMTRRQIKVESQKKGK